MTDAKVVERALEVVKLRYPEAKKVRLESIVPDFLDGQLAIMDIEDEEGDELENFVYFVGDQEIVLSSSEDLAWHVGKSKQRNIIDEVLRVGGISGVIAVIITLVIAYIVISASDLADVKVPDILANALSVILGFYFGSATAR